MGYSQKDPHVDAQSEPESPGIKIQANTWGAGTIQQGKSRTADP